MSVQWTVKWPLFFLSTIIKAEADYSIRMARTDESLSSFSAVCIVIVPVTQHQFKVKVGRHLLSTCIEIDHYRKLPPICQLDRSKVSLSDASVEWNFSETDRRRQRLSAVHRSLRDNPVSDYERDQVTFSLLMLR